MFKRWSTLKKTKKKIIFQYFSPYEINRSFIFCNINCDFFFLNTQLIKGMCYTSSNNHLYLGVYYAIGFLLKNISLEDFHSMRHSGFLQWTTINLSTMGEDVLTRALIVGRCEFNLH